MKVERTWRTISLLAALSVALIASTTSAQYSGGSGTADDPYQITTAADLIALGETPDDYDKHFILTADIDLDPSLPGGKRIETAVIAPFNTEFDGIPFKGVFDGNDHVISHLTIDGRRRYHGLFGQLAPEGMICNLGIEDIQVAVMGYYVGGLVAQNNGGVIQDCHITGYIEAGSFVGGLVGINESGRIQDCHSNVDIIAGNAGGLVGVNRSGTILNCYSTGNITAGSASGGLVGSNSGFIEGCHSTGSLTNTDCYGGGLVGYNDSVILNCYSTTVVTNGEYHIGGLVGANWTNGLILGCHSNSAVDGHMYVGGLVGYNGGGAISMCSAQGSVVSDGYVGGLVGCSTNAQNNEGRALEAWLSNCYSSASVAGTNVIGGLVGANKAMIVNCYSSGQVVGEGNVGGLTGLSVETYSDQICAFWDIERSGQSASAVGTGLTTTQMQDPNTYRSAGWDFVDSWTDGTSQIWMMPADGNYPVLAGPNDYVPPQLQGDGTAKSPYLLHDAAELGAVCHCPTQAHYRLANDIDLAGIRWGAAPIPFFNGKFDGKDLSVSNLTVAGPTYLGLFGSVRSGAEVKNLNIVDANIVGTLGLIGGIAGKNCGDISFCSVSGTVSGLTTVGGIVGQNTGYSTVSDCRNDSNIEGNDSIGGIVGENEGTISRVCSYGPVENTGAYAGGLVGTNWSIVTNSYNAGPVSGNHGAGLIGAHLYGELSNSYNTGLLRGTDQWSICALVGGPPNGGGRGVMAASTGPNCFWDITSSGNPYISSGIGTGLETAQMQTAATFLEAGWDFVGETANGIEDIWWIDENNDYPRLWWETLGQ